MGARGAATSQSCTPPSHRRRLARPERSSALPLAWAGRATRMAVGTSAVPRRAASCAPRERLGGGVRPGRHDHDRLGVLDGGDPPPHASTRAAPARPSQWQAILLPLPILTKRMLHSGRLAATGADLQRLARRRAAASSAGMLATVATCAVEGREGRPVRCRWASLARGCPGSSWWACRMPRCARPRSGCGPPSATAAWSSRTGGATVVADSILDEGTIRALAEPTDRRRHPRGEVLPQLAPWRASPRW